MATRYIQRMSILWQVGYVVAVVLGLAYGLFPERTHTFGFESLRRSSADQSAESNTPVWLYRGLGALFLCIGVTGLL